MGAPRAKFPWRAVSGSVAAFLGFWLAYQWDCPIGPTDVVLLGIIYAFGFAVKKIVSLFKLTGPHGSQGES